MSTATWRSVFTYNKYTQICARALRQSLSENQRAEVERRGLTALRYQNWEDGKGGQQRLKETLFLSKGTFESPGGQDSCEGCSGVEQFPGLACTSCRREYSKVHAIRDQLEEGQILTSDGSEALHLEWDRETAGRKASNGLWQSVKSRQSLIS